MTGVKFNFDNDFEADKEQVAEEEAITLERQLRESHESGFREGHTAGESAALHATEERIAEVMNAAVSGVTALGSKHAETTDRIERDSVQLAFIISKKLASAALDKYPASEIEAMIRECFEVAREEPKLVVRVAEDLIESVAQKCEEIRTRSSFSGEVIVIGDNEIARNDCIVEWPDGGAEHRTETSMDTIERLIQDFMFQKPDEMTAAGETPAPAAQEIPEVASAPEVAAAPEATEPDTHADADIEADSETETLEAAS